MRETIEAALSERILILDGAMGTSIQTLGLSEADFRGELAGTAPQKGNNDLLNITRPRDIEALHLAYLEAGADIIETNTFNANAISQRDYGCAHLARDMNEAGAALAKAARDTYRNTHPSAEIFIAGSVGPTAKSLSLASAGDDPSARDMTFSEMAGVYAEQIESLLSGGVDLLLFETIFDGLSAKAALYAADRVFLKLGTSVPVMVSATIANKGGRLLSGQSVAAFFRSLPTTHLLSVGLNCSFGAADLLPHMRRLAQEAPHYISFHPNAGLPDADGNYAETPGTMAGHILELAKEGCLNIAGGCCGTTPAHIRALKEALAGVPPRTRPDAQHRTFYCGLDPLEVDKRLNFVNVGERANVMGSKKFRDLISAKDYDGALRTVRAQVEKGAQILDINFDDPMLDAKEEMTRFLRLLANEPDIAALPVMIDSSRTDVLFAGIQAMQGKPVVNSISLKNGEEVFLRDAAEIRALGAAVVVMAFDETGQADTFERKIEVAGRAYRLLTEQIGFPPEDIVFDPGILAIATGLPEHDGYAVDFIEAVRWIKENLPHAKTSGGVSNLSFSFRGKNRVREAMHSVFLYHAVNAGLDMGIVNAGVLPPYDTIPGDLRTLCEDLVLNRDKTAAEKLFAYDGEGAESTADVGMEGASRSETPVYERLFSAIVRGNDEHLEADLLEALPLFPSAMAIVEGPLLEGMGFVGERFGEGKMFLPQVVKTARLMAKAVELLKPHIEKTGEPAERAGKAVLATVFGDVHDIGKNIVSVVLRCNGLEVIDLGIMVPAETIVETAIADKADLVVVSGLITPSLSEMRKVAEAMARAGLTIPLMVGGATTSKEHTALHIAPAYRAGVVQTGDASACARAAKILLSPEERAGYLPVLEAEYADIRRLFAEKKTAASVPVPASPPASDEGDGWTEPSFFGVRRFETIAISDVMPYLNFSYLYRAYDLLGADDNPEREQMKTELLQWALDMLMRIDRERLSEIRASIGVFKARTSGDDVTVLADGGEETFHFFRQEGRDGLSLADFAHPPGSDTGAIGGFLLTAGGGNYRGTRDMLSEEDDILFQVCLNMLAEAASEYLHRLLRSDLWRTGTGGIRPAFGYGSLPDHSEKATLMRLLDRGNDLGISLTGRYMLDPGPSVAGLYFGKGRYFSVGDLSDGALDAYASRTGRTVSELRDLFGS